jgi:hypothetical protein
MRARKTNLVLLFFLNLVQLVCTHADDRSTWIASTESGACMMKGQFGDAEMHHGCCNKSEVYVWDTGRAANGTMERVLEGLKGKKLVFSGDSISQQTYHALQSSLAASGISYSEAFFTVMSDFSHKLGSDVRCGDHGDGSCHLFRQTSIPAYSVEIYNLFFWSMSLPAEYDDEPFEKAWNMNHLFFQHFVNISDGMIVNIGLHYDSQPLNKFAQVIRFLRDTLRADRREHPWKRHAYRLTFPTHFGLYGTHKQHSGTCSNVAESHSTAEAAAGIIGDAVPILDMSSVMRDRGAFHSKNPFGKHDCAHWCYSYELFYPYWEMIVALVTDKNI